MSLLWERPECLPPPPDISSFKRNLEETIQRYMAQGYKLTSRSDLSAVMERQAVFHWGFFLLWWIIFFPAAFIYIIPGARGKLNASLNVALDGSVQEMGVTLRDVEKAKKSSRVTGYVLLGIIGAIVIIAVIASLVNS